jgi:hypothetical protein
MTHHSASPQTIVAAKISPLESWLSALDTLGVQYLILDAKRDNRLLKLVQAHPKWTLDFSDGEAVLFARTGALME